MSQYPNFSMRFRGFDRTEVMAALAKLASENEEAWREIDRLGAEMDRLQIAMAEQADNERYVQRALVTASKVADEIRERAKEEARQILRVAEEQGETILDRLRNQARGIESQIDTLLTRRRDVETSIEAFVKALSAEVEQARQRQLDDTADAALAESSPVLLELCHSDTAKP